jgi:hypothetical protein
MAPCLDFSSAGGGLGALAQARAQLLWEPMAQGVRQAVLALGSQAVMEAGALTFAFQEGGAVSSDQATAAGSRKRKAAGSDGPDAAADRAAVHMLWCAPLKQQVYPKLVDKEGGRKLMDLDPQLASSSNSSLVLNVQLPPDAPPAQLYTCGGGTQADEERRCRWHSWASGWLCGCTRLPRLC